MREKGGRLKAKEWRKQRGGFLPAGRSATGWVRRSHGRDAVAGKEGSRASRGCLTASDVGLTAPPWRCWVVRWRIISSLLRRRTWKQRTAQS